MLSWSATVAAVNYIRLNRVQHSKTIGTRPSLLHGYNICGQITSRPRPDILEAKPSPVDLLIERKMKLVGK